MCASAAADAFDLRIGAVDSDLSYRIRLRRRSCPSGFLPSDIGRLYWDDEGGCILCRETAEEVARSGSVSGAADAMNTIAQNPDGEKRADRFAEEQCADLDGQLDYGQQRYHGQHGYLVGRYDVLR